MTGPDHVREGFHAAQGWYFRRSIDGSVTIYTELGNEVTLGPGTWASVVAAVSERGEGHDTWHAAMDLHGEPEPAD